MSAECRACAELSQEQRRLADHLNQARALVRAFRSSCAHLATQRFSAPDVVELVNAIVDALEVLVDVGPSHWRGTGGRHVRRGRRLLKPSVSPGGRERQRAARCARSTTHRDAVEELRGRVIPLGLLREELKHLACER